MTWSSNLEMMALEQPFQTECFLSRYIYQELDICMVWHVLIICKFNSGEPIFLRLQQPCPSRMHPVFLRLQYKPNSIVQLQWWKWSSFGQSGSIFLCQKREGTMQVIVTIILFKVYIKYCLHLFSEFVGGQQRMKISMYLDLPIKLWVTLP